MKKLNKFGVAVSLALSLVMTVPAAAQNVNFVISGGVPGTPSDKAADEIVAELSARSEGRITGRKVPGDAIGGEREITEAIQLGTVEMALLSHMGMDSVVGKLGFAWFPYMFQTYEQADEHYANGWIGEEITRVLEQSSVIQLATIENGFRVMSNRERSIASLSDLAGLKIRVPEIPELLSFYNHAGALPVAIGGSDVLPALQQGTIDGVDNSLMNLNAMAVIEPQEYITRTNHSYSAGGIVASTQFWGGLSDEDKALFVEVAEAAAKKQIEASRKLEEDLYASIANTIAVEDVTPELDTALRGVALKVWEEFGSKYDSAVMERIRSEFYETK